MTGASGADTSFVDPGTPDAQLVRWLAEATGRDVAAIERELELGDRRRTFVVDELLDAGYEGAELLRLVVRLCGVDRDEAVRLVDGRRGSAAADRNGHAR